MLTTHRCAVLVDLTCHAGVALSQPLCLALLSVFEACGQSQQAQDVLTAASNASLPLTTDLYNAALRCCVLEQHGERAVEVWEEMQVCHTLIPPPGAPELPSATSMTILANRPVHAHANASTTKLWVLSVCHLT